MSMLRDIAKNLLMSPAVIEQMTDLLAAELEKQLRLHVGGDSFYVAKTMSQQERIARDESIRNAWNGSNLSDLAKQYELHHRQVRRIVQKK